jgi:catechol 2,3-dioxygenase-like lactoylglutathione lyase family enzyme
VKVLGLHWLGVPAERYEEMVRLLRDVMGLPVNFDEGTTVEFSLPSGDEIQLFAPGDHYYDFFGQHAAGPVPLFEVDDVHAARSELEAAGIEVIGSIERDSNWEWAFFRAPDGNLYELGSRRRGSPPTR